MSVFSGSYKYHGDPHVPSWSMYIKEPVHDKGTNQGGGERWIVFIQCPRKLTSSYTYFLLSNNIMYCSMCLRNSGEITEIRRDPSCLNHTVITNDTHIACMVFTQLPSFIPSFIPTSYYCALGAPALKGHRLPALICIYADDRETLLKQHPVGGTDSLCCVLGAGAIRWVIRKLSVLV